VSFTKEGLRRWFTLRLDLLSLFIVMSPITFLILSKTSNESLAGLIITYSTQLTNIIAYFAYMYSEL
jgi:hypothetical protein